MPGEGGDWEAALGGYLLHPGPFSHRLTGKEGTIGPSLVDENTANSIQ